jgi:hypothetical protein
MRAGTWALSVVQHVYGNSALFVLPRELGYTDSAFLLGYRTQFSSVDCGGVLELELLVIHVMEPKPAFSTQACVGQIDIRSVLRSR